MSLSTVSDYSMLEKIGTGSYATVYKAFKKGGSREVVAIKCVDKSSLSKSAIDNLVTEIKLLNVLKHEHIVEMKDFFWDEGHIYIVMEYCDGGDLSRFIKKKHKLPENVCRRFLQQLALALRYLRDHNVCHMDLKPQNLLLTRKPQLVLKVGDFGFAQYLSNSEHKFAIRGSPLYMAPEMLLKHKYDARVDLWSVGVIMYECLFGKAPYSSSSFQELAEKIKDSQPIEIPKAAHVSAMCKDLLMALLKHNPADRITYNEFFAHEFLDLEHAPTKENYDKAVALVHKAVEMDAEKNVKEAFYLYCEALRYFIPILTNESDLKRKEILRHRVNDYIRRAETLKVAFVDDKDEKCAPAENKGNTSFLQRIPSLERSSAFAYNELRILSKSTTGMTAALEIGEAGEQYLAEGNYALALEKFQSCLGVLVPLLGKEPLGRRRDLLYKQIQIWMKEAESTKGLLASKDIDSSQRTSDEQCILQ
ncbi:serine/threonine-protein kinase ULK3 [Cataglyphis hispanica]|uniref:serine/threonine-protein kinase ULK3 n=1 Tax=Cataglyphis hispanica TaxID=1086592 RepID=UPI00217F98FE|nr:serine/threonine-protein kinase ULK3 [Cataglyphis hispanica]XP_050445774.1 serine/threonine-protein kinase ULK3 [Cataglyphis hispanica]XP_050445775.1 serine/threonine-protein kinase ULK3 [Cataglyphis hispanica]XP_050445776.1 serine/threonine-protein kinase ULK3 [Cataglyphis hispanica]